MHDATPLSSMRKMHAHGMILFDTKTHNTQKPKPQIVETIEMTEIGMLRVLFQKCPHN